MVQQLRPRFGEGGQAHTQRDPATFATQRSTFAVQRDTFAQERKTFAFGRNRCNLLYLLLLLTPSMEVGSRCLVQPCAWLPPRTGLSGLRPCSWLPRIGRMSPTP